MEGFARRKVKVARQACEAQGMLGHPTDRDFLEMVRGGMISNCHLTANAVTNTHRIFGPDLAGIRGRTLFLKSRGISFFEKIRGNSCFIQKGG